MKAVLYICLCLFIVESAFSHGGRTNSAGCHNNRKTGDYHCHGSKSSYKSLRQKNKYQSNSNNKSSNSGQGKELIEKIQKLLNRLGYDAGNPNGIMTKKTKMAISRFQINNDLDINGRASYSLLEELKNKGE